MCTFPYCHTVPNQPATPHHSVRVRQDLWQAAKQIAHERGETLTDIIIRALVRYVRTYGHANNAGE